MVYGLITRSHDYIVIKVKEPNDKLWHLKSIITRSHVISITKHTFRTLRLKKLWSQNHIITCDLQSDATKKFYKAWSQDHRITLWSQLHKILLNLWNTISCDHKITYDLQTYALSLIFVRSNHKIQDHIVITITKVNVKTSKLKMLWSQNYMITWDLKSDALYEILWSQLSINFKRAYLF